MTDKEFRRLRRSELIDIIYELQTREQEHQETIAQLREALERRDQVMREAGSIAEATVALSDIFAKAQAVADTYLEEVRHLRDTALAEAGQTCGENAAEEEEKRDHGEQTE